VITRCSSSGDLYNFSAPAANHSTHGLLAASTSTELWHRRLGHPGRDTMSHLHKQSFIPCNKAASHVCHACQLGKHVRLPFTRSSSKSVAPFALIHCDLWTSPVLSNSGFKYYLVIVDDFSHFMWTFPLRRKSDTADTLIAFVAFVHTQFSRPLVAMQADNGTEFINSTVTSFFTKHGIRLRLACPIPPLKTARPNVLYAQLTMSPARSFSSLLCHHLTGPKRWLRQHILSTFDLPNL
jgi:hypothetical protein